jgi:hypothetical protein
MSAVAVDARVTSEPPVNADSSGVSSLKWPVTVTLTRFAGSAPLEQSGEQLIATSAGTIVTKEPDDSLVAAQTTRLVGLQAAPLEYEVGFWAASIAPARAESTTVIWE